MAAFATGLAAPFFVLALFPSFLQKTAQERRLADAREGGARIRGARHRDEVFELGRSDSANRFDLARNVSGLLGGAVRAARAFICSGFLRLEGIKPDDHLGVGRVLVAALFLMFSISLLPGLFGASLGNVEAFIPVQAQGQSRC